MKITYFFAALMLYGIVSCNSGTKKALETEPEMFDISKVMGSYASPEYAQRGEGYDWVGVILSQVNDSTAKVLVRSRSDIKKPTCTFEGEATILGPDTLVSSYEGNNIILVFRNDSLWIDAQDPQNANFLYYFCSGGASLGGVYTKIDGALDTLQVNSSMDSLEVTLK
ncbi:MAG: hypothetical protein ACRCXN_03135 [Bacteroidales bacterium]